ncbi:Protein TRANSPARENT TESTA 9 [Orobanche minor]
MKVQTVNEVNKDFVIEALRSISELITWGDQHDAAYFEFFMEKQVKGELVRILKITRTVINYLFSNEYVNYLITYTYSYDFRNEELLSYYISFLS